MAPSRGSRPDRTVPRSASWEGLQSVDVAGGHDVHWLLAVPISEDEHALLLDRGYFELERLLVSHEVEYFDLKRQSSCSRAELPPRGALPGVGGASDLGHPTG